METVSVLARKMDWTFCHGQLIHGSAQHLKNYPMDGKKSVKQCCMSVMMTKIINCNGTIEGSTSVTRRMGIYFKEKREAVETPQKTLFDNAVDCFWQLDRMGSGLEDWLIGGRRQFSVL